MSYDQGEMLVEPVHFIGGSIVSDVAEAGLLGVECDADTSGIDERVRMILHILVTANGHLNVRKAKPNFHLFIMWQTKGHPDDNLFGIYPASYKRSYLSIHIITSSFPLIWTCFFILL